MIQQAGGVGTDVLAVVGGPPGQGVQVAHRVDRDLAGQISRIGVPAAGFDPRVDFDQLSSAVELHRARVGPGQDVLADQLSGNGVDPPGHLDVPIPGDLGAAVDRDLERLDRGGQQQRGLLVSEDLGRAGPGGAMNPDPGDLSAPPLGAGPAISQVEELFTGEEIRPHIGHRPLDPRLVLRVAHPGGINDEASGLGILSEHVVEPGLGVIGLIDDRLEVVRILWPAALCGRRRPTPSG